MKTKNKAHTIATVIILIISLAFSAFLLFRDTSAPSLHKITWNKNPDITDTAEVVLAFARENGYKPENYPDSLVDLLERNPETKDFVLNYPAEFNKQHTIDLSSYAEGTAVPLFMQWDSHWGYMEYGDDLVAMNGCGPVCLAMAGYYWYRNDDFSPDRMVRFAIDEGYCVPGNGTSWTLISEGGKKLGLDVTEIPLDENRINRNLEVGNPIICVMGPGDFTTSGHYIVMTGLENGLIRVNDPNSYANSEKLWDYDDICDQIRNLWVIRK